MFNLKKKPVKELPRPLPKGTKYRLLAGESFIPDFLGWNSGAKRIFYRIQALCDIPEHNVKAGDLGGYISSNGILSQNGTCWVGRDAVVYGKVKIEDNAYLGGKSRICYADENSRMTINDNVRILDNAQIIIAKYGKMEKVPQVYTKLSGNVVIAGNAEVINVSNLQDNVKISGNAKVYGAKSISGNSVITDHSKVMDDVVIADGNISGEAVIQAKAIVSNATVSKKAQIGKEQIITSGVFMKTGIFVNPKEKLNEITIGAGNTADTENMDTNTQNTLSLYNEILGEIASYETDIARIIRYPLMTDRTNPYTNQMVSALKKAKRLASKPSDEAFTDAVNNLEEKFLAAESNAIKVSDSELSEADLKKTIKAKDLFSIAGDEAAGEHERKMALTQGFKQLVGIMTVPEVAVDTFRVKVGLKELEA